MAAKKSLMEKAMAAAKKVIAKPAAKKVIAKPAAKKVIAKPAAKKSSSSGLKQFKSYAPK